MTRKQKPEKHRLCCSDIFKKVEKVLTLEEICFGLTYLFVERGCPNLLKDNYYSNQNILANRWKPQNHQGTLKHFQEQKARGKGRKATPETCTPEDNVFFS